MFAKLLAVLYGIVNIVAAVYIFYSLPIPSALKAFVVFILLFKGIPSFAGDFMCKIDGVIDVTAALAIAGFFIIPNPVNIIIALMLVWVALLSFF
jgi:hypothetical protein